VRPFSTAATPSVPTISLRSDEMQTWALRGSARRLWQWASAWVMALSL